MSLFKNKNVPTLQDEVEIALQSFTDTIHKLEDISNRAHVSANQAYADAKEMLEKEKYYRSIADNNFKTVEKLKNLFTN